MCSDLKMMHSKSFILVIDTTPESISNYSVPFAHHPFIPCVFVCVPDALIPPSENLTTYK
jgi:hypothetical protein